MNSEPIGCLGRILQMLGFPVSGQAVEEVLPYRQRDDFLSAAELSFYHVLRKAVGTQYVVCPKVNLWDLFFVARPNENRGAKGKIDRKHVDFVLCDPATMRPICGVELDDRSHQKESRMKRDVFVNSVFQTAGLPLLHVPAARSYSIADLSSQVAEVTRQQQAIPAIPPSQSNSTTTACPRCGSELTERTVSKGTNKGERFLGCSSFPKCRHTQPVTT